MARLQTTQFAVPEDVIDLGIGQPPLSLLPLDGLKEAANQCLGQGDPSILQYGAAEGDGRFRLALARFLTSHQGAPAEMDQILITSGVSQALDLICTRFTQPGDTILVEEPTYFLVPFIFRDHRLNVVGVPVDEHGLVIEALEEKLARHRPVFLYTIPAFHNPTSATLPAERRDRLVRLSRERGFLVVADEVYQMLHFGAAPPPPLAAHVGTGQVLSLGSFSKILAPGLRLGWVQSAPAHLERIAHAGLVESGGGLNPFASGVVRAAIESGLQERWLGHLRLAYAEQAAALCLALRRQLTGVLTFAEPGGGLFVWARLLDGRNAADLLPETRKQKVNYQPGPRFSCGGGLKDHLRLSFANYGPERLAEGVARLARAVRATT